MKLPYIFLSLAVVVLIGLVGLVFVLRLNKVSTNIDNNPLNPTPTTVLNREDQCRKNIQSDNLLFEDQLNTALKTCQGTQICTYNDFRMYSQANGRYFPDWRSEDYMKIKVQECLEHWPTPTLTATSSANF